jgi:hypothetical protein
MEPDDNSVTGKEVTIMRRSRQESMREQVGFLRRQFLQDADSQPIHRELNL